MLRERKTLPGVKHQEVREYETRHRQTALKIAREGVVLLENKKSGEKPVLPLKKGTRIGLYGSGARKTIKGGSGSGDVNERSCVTIEQGLEHAGFVIEKKEWLDRYDQVKDASIESWKNGILARVNEVHPFTEIYFTTPYHGPEENKITENEMPEDAEAVLYVISRISGEGADRGNEPGDFLFSESEKENLKKLDETGKDLIVILNTGGLMDLTYLDGLHHVKAVIYASQGGMEGGTALGEILSGDVTPSGKLTDSWGSSYEMWPGYDQFGRNNGDVQTEYYNEGIFVGYRWFDATGKSLRYPFGFGLSYTDFEIKTEKVSVSGKQVQVEVSVKNTGNTYAGKETVQVYVEFSGKEGISHEKKRLAGFGKTDVLEPGESQKLTISFDGTALERFDQDESAWVVDQGDYGVLVGDSSADLVTAAVLRVEEDVVRMAVDHISPLQKELKEMEWTPQAVVYEEKLPVVVLKPENLAKEKKAPKENPYEAKAKELTEKLTAEQMIKLVCGKTGGAQAQAGAASVNVPGAAGETVEYLASEIGADQGVPGMALADGPAGVRLAQKYYTDANGQVEPVDIVDGIEHGLFAPEKVLTEGEEIYYQYCSAFPIGAMVAMTWNTELAYEMGLAAGEEMEEFQVALWLAPGMNIHRNPLCGRNFEYFSEDPLVSGRMAGAITRGVQTIPGKGTTIKHFACNNQEDNRMGVDSVVGERALREIYLRGFQYAIEETQPKALMTSYNLINGVHSANSYDLCTVSARKEWGYEGMIMTDWMTTTDGGSLSYVCMKAGNDMIMPGCAADHENIRQALNDGKLTMDELKACVVRIIRLALECEVKEQN